MTGTLIGTDASFQDMLNEYLPNSLLKSEIIKRDYFLSNCEKDNKWKGGSLIVPFEGAHASSLKLGGLTEVEDINEDVFVRGEISSQPEMWGAMKFKEKDLMRNDKVDAQSLIELLPNRVENFVMYVKNSLSLMFTNGAAIASATANGTASDGIEVDRIERFVVGQRIVLKGTVAAAQAYWVKSINKDDDILVLATTKALTTVADVSAYTTADAAKLYLSGAETSANQFTSLKASLLSAANGGSASLYGQTKTAYPYLQAINISAGAGGPFGAWTSVNFLENLFRSSIILRNKGKGNADKAVMSYTNLGWVLIALQVEKGAYRQAGDSRVSQYGWTEIDIIGARGKLTVVAVQEVDDDYVMLLDMSAIKIYSNGFIKKRKGPGGNEYFEVRNTNGFVYVVDMCFFGDIVLLAPEKCGIIHSISISA